MRRQVVGMRWEALGLVLGGCAALLVTGCKGNQGPQGAMGDTGSQGPTGPAGPRGLAGPTGPQGPEGPAGPAGPAGAPGAGDVQWVDATGAVAAPVTGSGGSIYFDDSGLVWRIDPTTLQISSRYFSMEASFVYESTDCSGPEYIYSGGDLVPLPRVPFPVVADGSLRVRPDDLPEVAVHPCSQRTAAGCSPGTCGGSTVRSLLASGTRILSDSDIPVPPFTAPLHPELLHP